MPIYEYQCTKCHHHLEALQKISDKPLRECPECGKHTLKRLMSAPMFRLAGSGWYETDFKSDKENKRNLVGEKGEPETSSESKPEPKAETKTETKTDAKAESKKEAAEKKSSRTMVTRPAIKKSGGARPKPAARKPARKPGKR
jgi:putative FmdB family regulatory protein